MNKNASVESCVETPVAPDWLSKLENRREKLAKAKLGHESGAGSSCGECGDKCPGLDLHFWRKVCRNCKCRKDQHLCADDDFSGWAQFEILGQIRSKPAYMKIKALADQPIKVEWIPPNITSDLASDYMGKLESHQIPVAGSDAAARRKQQLEFQVPPHDLDATLCHNLTESESLQLEQYVKKVRANCVGQGCVVRVKPIIQSIIAENYNKHHNLQENTANTEVMNALGISQAQIVNDKCLTRVIFSEKVAEAIRYNPPSSLQKTLVAFSRPLTPDHNDNEQFTPEIKKKLTAMNLNGNLIKSLVENGKVYDKLIQKLEKNNVDFSGDAILPSIAHFRKDYLNSPGFKTSVIEYVENISPQYLTPIKSKPINPNYFYSPLPQKHLAQTKTGALMKQETPMRKVKFGGVNITYMLDLPCDERIQKDAILSQIINSEALSSTLQNPEKIVGKNSLIISNNAMFPDFEKFSSMNSLTQKKLQNMNINQQAIQSGVLNEKVYDKIYEELDKRGVDYKKCKLLHPIAQFRKEFLENIPFQKEIKSFVEKIPNNLFIAFSEPQSELYTKPQLISPEHILSKGKSEIGFLSNPQSPLKNHMEKVWKSTDSGFESKPPTPNYSTFPSIAESEQNEPKIVTIPGLEQNNMYPYSNTNTCFQGDINQAKENLHELKIDNISNSLKKPQLNLKCKDCLGNILSGEVAVKAERAGQESAWHPQCFKCYKCRELLADLVYFFHGGQVYCGRDLALILKIPRCNACDELIFTKEYTAAEGATFHIKHFCCYQCDEPLAGQKYIPDEKTNMPVCLKCYDQYYAERCQNCNEIIGPAEQGVSWDKLHWHSKCFICSGVDCNKSLLGGRFCVKNNMPFCSSKCVQSL